MSIPTSWFVVMILSWAAIGWSVAVAVAGPRHNEDDIQLLINITILAWLTVIAFVVYNIMQPLYLLRSP